MDTSVSLNELIRKNHWAQSYDPPGFGFSKENESRLPDGFDVRISFPALARTQSNLMLLGVASLVVGAILIGIDSRSRYVASVNRHPPAPAAPTAPAVEAYSYAQTEHLYPVSPAPVTPPPPLPLDG
jgi:hypothetical protein